MVKGLCLLLTGMLLPVEKLFNIHFVGITGYGQNMRAMIQVLFHNKSPLDDEIGKKKKRQGVLAMPKRQYAWWTPVRLADGLGRPSRPSCLGCCLGKIHPKRLVPPLPKRSSEISSKV